MAANMAFFELKSRIESLAKSPPTSENLAEFLEIYMQSPELRSHAFNKLSNPQWLKPLEKRGLFKSPVNAEQDETGRTCDFEEWPPSIYLKNIAGDEPEQVIEIALSIESNNLLIVYNLTEASLLMPEEYAVRWAEKLIEWLDGEFKFEGKLARRIGELTSYLSNKGYPLKALGLAKELLRILPDPEIESKKQSRQMFGRFPEPNFRFDRWEYKDILNENIPDLVHAAPLETLRMFADFMDHAIRFSRFEDEGDRSDDFSCIWRPAIEDHQQNHDFEIMDPLVDALRDAAEWICKNMPEKREAVISILEKKRWYFFKRLIFHLYRLFPSEMDKAVALTLTDKENFEHHTLHHEYTLLLKEQFKNLEDADKLRILSWINDGPAKLYPATSDGQSAETEKLRYGKFWQRDRLAPISETLTGTWKERYSALIGELGELEHPDLEVFLESWEGPTSPLTAQEIQLMTVHELVEYLVEWEPSYDLASPTPDGLRSVIGPVVEQDPAKYAAGIDYVMKRNVDPTYIRSIIYGFSFAAKAGAKQFPWFNLLVQCKEIVRKDREIPGRTVEEKKSRELEPDWGGTRKAIAVLLQNGFRSEFPIPFKNREIVWSIIEPITEDPEPDLDYERKYGGENMNPRTLSINTVRGEAMHTVFHYSLWVFRNMGKNTDRTSSDNRSFNEIPEVRCILEKHLDPDNDPTETVRAVFGFWLPQIVYMDVEWTKNNLRLLFPDSAEHYALRAAAWNTYLQMRGLYDNVFLVLKYIYAKAVESLAGNDDNDIAEPRNLNNRLSEHLMILYTRGTLEIEGNDGLLQQFFHNAGDKLIGHAFSFIGRDLKKDKIKNPALIDRLRVLWDWRFEKVRSNEKPEQHSAEYSAFGLWFNSGVFDDEWALDHITEIMRIGGCYGEGGNVVEQLVNTIEKIPIRSFECFGLLIEKNRDPWLMSFKQEEMKILLRTFLRSPNKEIRDKATAIVHEIGKKGHFQYGDLLIDNGEQADNNSIW